MHVHTCGRVCTHRHTHTHTLLDYKMLAPKNIKFLKINLFSVFSVIMEMAGFEHEVFNCMISVYTFLRDHLKTYSYHELVHKLAGSLADCRYELFSVYIIINN